MTLTLDGGAVRKARRRAVRRRHDQAVVVDRDGRVRVVDATDRVARLARAGRVTVVELMLYVNRPSRVGR
jgi:hypothetical protein